MVEWEEVSIRRGLSSPKAPASKKQDARRPSTCSAVVAVQVRTRSGQGRAEVEGGCRASGLGVAPAAYVQG